MRKTTQGGAGSLRGQLAQLWPLARGSLCEVRKSCGREDCTACASGRRHPAWLFTFRQEGRPRCLHVPRPVVAKLRRAIGNGRQVERIMVEAGIRLVVEARRERGRR